MAMSRTQIKELSAVSEQMRSMAQEMREFADRGIQTVSTASAPTPLPQPAQLQFNQGGDWRNGLDFDMRTAPPEFLQAADLLLRLSDGGIRAQVVRSTRNSVGGTRPTSTVLMRWTRATGWVKA